MKISHFTALLLLGMLTAACSVDKNGDSGTAGESERPEAAVSQPAENASEAAAPQQEDGKPEASASEPSESKAAEQSEQGNKLAGKSMDADSYQKYAEDEKKCLKDLKESLDGIIDMAEDEKIPEERIKRFRQCADDYYKSVAENCPEHYRQHIQAHDKLIESMRNLEAKGIMGMAVNTCIGAFNLNKVQYMIYAGEADEKDLDDARNQMGEMAKQAEEETNRMKAEFLEKAKLNN